MKRHTHQEVKPNKINVLSSYKMATAGIMQLSSAKLNGSGSQRTQQVYAALGQCWQATEKHVYFPAYNIIPQLQ